MKRRRAGAALAALVISITGGSAVLAGGVAIVSTELADNGDGDGFADTNETVELRLVLRNTTSTDLHDVVLRLSTASPAIACIGRPLIRVGDLAAGEERRTDGAFVFTVGQVDRQDLGIGELADLFVELVVELSSNRVVGHTVPGKLKLDLDLDVSGGSGPTAFFEGFESGTFGAFEGHNMDAGLHSLTAADGYRCQYANPTRIQDPDPPATDCFLGASQTHADAFFWQIQTPEANNGGKAFSGNNSLYMGIFGPTADYQTTPVAVLEAVRLTSPINLGHQGVPPELSLKQQVDFLDSRNLVVLPAGEGPDRGILALQLADAAGQPVGDWIKLEPYLNVYDTLGTDRFYNCTFDPIDDGNTEDSFFDPTDPDRRLGPSSTCMPEQSFAYIGDTFHPFDPARAGNADGPGLEGSLGFGTWIDSRFNLDRFRGRRVRLRFLNTSLKVGAAQNWTEVLSMINPGPGDDGWWIDDVSVTGTLTEPATMVVDPAPNESLPGLGDGDGDGRIDACDVCPFDGDPLQPDDDLDGVGNACDNCPGVSDPDRTDSDGDGLGDPCDRCPIQDDSDDDLDGVPCAQDNCPESANVEQTDSDGDGLGNACDACPADSGNDQDGDGLCGNVDDCAVLYDPEQGGVLRLSGPLFAFGSVGWFEVSPDDRTVVYTASLPIGGPASGLFAARPGEDARIRTVDDLSDGRTISSAVFTPDGSRVVYQTSGTPPSRLYSAPLDGGAPVQLDELPFGYVDFSIAPSGLHVVYAKLHNDGDGYELYSVPADGGVPTNLTPGVLPWAVRQFVISHDSTRVFYIADGEQLFRDELYSVPIGGGASMKLNGPVGNGDVDSFELAGDDSVVVYHTRLPSELYSVPAAGGTPVLLFSGDLQGYEIAPDAASVVFWGYDVGMYAVPVVGGSTVPLASGYVISAKFSLDGARVLFTSDEAAQGVQELFSVPVSGGAPQRLNGPMMGDFGVIRFTLSPDGSTVAYLADEREVEVFELFAAPVAGGASVRLNGNLVALGNVVAEAVFNHDGTMLLYHADQDTDEVIELYLVATAGGPARKINNPLVAGGDVAMGSSPLSAFFRSDTAVVYAADQRVNDATEVFGAELVPGAGGDGGLCDCDAADETVFPGAPERNDGHDNQCPGDGGFGYIDELSGPVGFPSGDKTQLCWEAQAGAALYEIVRSDSPDFSTGCSSSTTSATCTVDTTDPPPGGVAYFLARSLSPFPGSWGPGADGAERTIVCP